MKQIKHLTLFYTLLGILCFNSVFGVLQTSVYAAASAMTDEEVEAERQAYYDKDINSNSWENWPAGPKVYASSAIVMEADTGTILYNKDMDEVNFPASITKIMTALVVLENCDLDEGITFSYDATHSLDYGSSSIARTEGEELTVEETLYGMLLASANECANALAEHVAGSKEEFATLMNEKAKELGCTNTHFTNPSGLHDENHYTSAHDMALITQAAIANDTFVTISGSENYTLRATNKNDEELLMQNHHYMISNYKSSKFLDDTVFAGKTGYTSDSLNTLVTCASRNGIKIIVVTMRTRGSGLAGEPTFSDTANLLDYASENFKLWNVAENEMNFTSDNSTLFGLNSDLLNDSYSMNIDPDGNIILPNGCDFSDASPSFSYSGEDDNSQAFLNYSYANQFVGTATVSLSRAPSSALSSDPEADSSHVSTVDAVATSKTNFFIINLKYILMVAILVICLLFIYFFIKKMLILHKQQIQNFTKKINKRRRRKSRYRKRRF